MEPRALTLLVAFDSVRPLMFLEPARSAQARYTTGVPDKDKLPTSSIVMKAIDASTFSELQAFTKDLESRPVDRLLRDVGDLVLPSESKAQIVSYVFAMKYRKANADERKTILDSLNATLARLPEGEQRERVRFIVDRLSRD